MKPVSMNIPLSFLELSALNLIVISQNIYAEALTLNESIFGKGGLGRH